MYIYIYIEREREREREEEISIQNIVIFPKSTGIREIVRMSVVKMHLISKENWWL